MKNVTEQNSKIEFREEKAGFVKPKLVITSHLRREKLDELSSEHLKTKTYTTARTSVANRVLGGNGFHSPGGAPQSDEDSCVEINRKGE